MWTILQLYLPVLFPSWRFFGEIGASPRIYYRTGQGPWLSAIDRPQTVSAWQMIARLFWNPDWNEMLYLVSLAERFLVSGDDPDAPLLLAEIARRVALRQQLIEHPAIRIDLETGRGAETVFEGLPNVH